MPQPASPSSASSSVKTAGTEGESKGKKTFASRKQGEDYNLNWFLYETFEGSNHCVYITEGSKIILPKSAYKPGNLYTKSAYKPGNLYTKSAYKPGVLYTKSAYKPGNLYTK